MSSIFATDARIPFPLNCSLGWPFRPTYRLVRPQVNLACCVLLNNSSQQLLSGSEGKWYSTPPVPKVKSLSQREWPYPNCLLGVAHVNLLNCAQTVPGKGLINTIKNHAKNCVSMDVCRTYSCTNILTWLFLFLFFFQDYNLSLVCVIQKSFSPFLSLSLKGQSESLAASNDCLKQQEG